MGKKRKRTAAEGEILELTPELQAKYASIEPTTLRRILKKGLQPDMYLWKKETARCRKDNLCQEAIQIFDDKVT
jgi:hypothetical protein